jgi:adenine-specific DNA-methyltransferase
MLADGKAGQMKEFLAYIQRAQKQIIAEFGDALTFCRELLTEDGPDFLPDDIANLLADAEADERDYAIASAYSLLIGETRRRELSAYFTPPVLSRAVLDASTPVLDHCDSPAVLDPACGGGSFLTPIARYLIAKDVAQGSTHEAACEKALNSLGGIEIDPGLASLSQTLLREMLARENGYRTKGKLRVVRWADALRHNPGMKFDLIVGNPPFGKIGSKRAATLLKPGEPGNMGGHTNLYALFLMRSLGWLKPGGGLVFVLPTSFVAGPYFASLRQEVLKRAKVVRIDLHEQRGNLFLGAVQDICLLSLFRRSTNAASDTGHEQEYELGVIDAKGTRRSTGSAVAKSGGEPWMLPVVHEVKVFAVPANKSGEAHAAFTLFDYGYRVRVGKVVPTREREQLHASRKRGDLPLLWASTIRRDGSFDFTASDRIGNARWYCSPDPKAMRYNTTQLAVVLQRTSNRDQARRLNAASIPAKFRTAHRNGFVAENHVIVIEALRAKPLVSPKKVAMLLNAAVVNERFSAVCGSFCVSAKLLQRLALPDPASVSKLRKPEIEHGLRKLFAGIKELLVSNAAGNAQNAIDEPGDLRRGAPIDKDASLKSRAIA